MAKTILLKRGTDANLPDLQEGEQGFTTDTEGVYIGTDTGNTIVKSPNLYYADASAADQGATANSRSIASLLISIGTSKQATIVLAHSGSGNTTTYTVGQNVDWSAYDNVTFELERGAVISHGAYTVNIPNIDAGLYQAFNGTGLVTLYYFDGIRPEWFGAKADNLDASATANTTAINKAANTAAVFLGTRNRGTLLLSSGTYKVTATSGNYAAVCFTSIKGVSAKTSIINNIGAGSALSLSPTSGANWGEAASFENFAVYGNASSEDGIAVNTQYLDAGTENEHRMFTNVHSEYHGRHGLVTRNAFALTFTNCRFQFNGGLGVYVYSVSGDFGVVTAFGTTRLNGPAGNAVTFINCNSMHNGGSADVSGDYLHGGVRFSTGAGVHWIGGNVEYNNAWGFIIGGTSGDPAFLVIKASIEKTYLEGNPNGLSATGGAIAAIGAWEELTIRDNYMVPGAGVGDVCYGLYIVGDNNNARTRLVEEGNYIRIQGLGGTEVAKHIEGIFAGQEQPIHKISNILIENGSDAAHIKVTLGNVWNGDSYAVTDNIGKDAVTTGVWQLDATGAILTLGEVGMGKSLLAVAAVTNSINLSATAFIVSGTKSGTTMQLTFKNAATGGALDLTTLVDTGTLAVNVHYIAGEYNGNY